MKYKLKLNRRATLRSDLEIQEHGLQSASSIGLQSASSIAKENKIALV